MSRTRALIRNKAPNFLRQSASLSSSAFQVIAELFAICNANNSIEKEREEEKIARLCNFFRDPRSRKVALFLHRYGATTSVELCEELGLDEWTVSRRLKALKILGVVTDKGRIGTPYRSPRERGAKVKIWTLTTADPQASIDAQIRYGELIKKELPPTRGPGDPDTEALKQGILTYMDQRGVREATKRELMLHLKTQGLQNLTQFDRAASELSREGYKIWR